MKTSHGSGDGRFNTVSTAVKLNIFGQCTVTRQSSQSTCPGTKLPNSSVMQPPVYCSHVRRFHSGDGFRRVGSAARGYTPVLCGATMAVW